LHLSLCFCLFLCSFPRSFHSCFHIFSLFHSPFYFAASQFLIPSVYFSLSPIFSVRLSHFALSQPVFFLQPYLLSPLGRPSNPQPPKHFPLSLSQTKLTHPYPLHITFCSSPSLSLKHSFNLSLSHTHTLLICTSLTFTHTHTLSHFSLSLSFFFFQHTPHLSSLCVTRRKEGRDKYKVLSSFPFVSYLENAPFLPSIHFSMPFCPTFSSFNLK
jgi:hypothetical protein